LITLLFTSTYEVSMADWIAESVSRYSPQKVDNVKDSKGRESIRQGWYIIRIEYTRRNEDNAMRRVRPISVGCILDLAAG
jgi:hypothetical protein